MTVSQLQDTTQDKTDSSCFHCGLPVPDDLHLQVEIDGEERDMCCTGCEAVANAIVQNGLTSFYTYRTKNSDKPQDLIPKELQVYDNDLLQKSFVRSANEAGLTDVREASLIL
ncbi:MAG: heavy metal translocating P-type ATPase metal-binding domain-containing protein, partial [Thiotrichaceae bacterium]